MICRHERYVLHLVMMVVVVREYDVEVNIYMPQGPEHFQELLLEYVLVSLLKRRSSAEKRNSKPSCHETDMPQLPNSKPDPM